MLLLNVTRAFVPTLKAALLPKFIIQPLACVPTNKGVASLGLFPGLWTPLGCFFYPPPSFPLKGGDKIKKL